MKKLFFFERYLIHVFTFLLIFFFVILFVRFFVFSPGRVNGPSMESNFLDDKLFFVDRLSYLLKPPQRFDVVQFIEPQDKKLIIKRIIGLPGEIVEIKRGNVFVTNNIKVEPVELDESSYLDAWTYTKLFAQKRPARYLVGPYEYFVLGDNRDNSVDSRVYGTIHRSKIVGKVMGHLPKP